MARPVEPYVARSGRYSVEIDPASRTLALSDAESGTRWVSGAPFARIRVPGPPREKMAYWGDPEPSTEIPWRGEQLSIEHTDRALRLVLAGIDIGGATVDVACSIVAQDDRVRFGVDEVRGLPAGREVIVDFPWRLGAASPGDEGALVLPRGAGILVDYDKRRAGYTFENLIYSGGQNGWSAPLWGQVRGGHILAAIAKTPFDCYLRAELGSESPAVYAASPCWLMEGGRLDYGRRIDYAVYSGGHVALAHWYRRELIAAGKYRTLAEKAEGHPLVKNLPGSALAEMHISFNGDPKNGRDPRDLVDTAARMGFPGVVAYSVGIWQRPFHGTNAVPPDAGTPEALAEAARYGHAVNPAYHVTVYENLVDMWPTTPGYDPDIMAKQRDGSIRPNWYSEKHGGRSSTVCPVCRLETAKRDWGGLKALIGEGSIYVDVEGAMELNECFDAAHPVTREQDAHYRSEVLRHARDVFGTSATESMPMDCLADSVDVGAYFPVYQWIGYGCSEKPRIEPAVIPIPLLPLVYHGSLLHMNPKQTDFYTCDPLFVPLWELMPDATDEFSLAISKELRDTSWATMEDHRFLTAPRVDTANGYHAADVQYSRFSDGVAIVANFSATEFTWEGTAVAPQSYRIVRG